MTNFRPRQQKLSREVINLKYTIMKLVIMEREVFKVGWARRVSRLVTSVAKSRLERCVLPGDSRNDVNISPVASYQQPLL